MLTKDGELVAKMKSIRSAVVQQESIDSEDEQPQKEMLGMASQVSRGLGNSSQPIVREEKSPPSIMDLQSALSALKKAPKEPKEKNYSENTPLEEEVGTFLSKARQPSSSVDSDSESDGGW